MSVVNIHAAKADLSKPLARIEGRVGPEFFEPMTEAEFKESE